MPITSAPPPPKSNPNTSNANPGVSRVTPRVTKQREETVAQLGMFAQVPLVATKQYADAGAIGQFWPGIAHELAVLAETQEPIARVIDPLMQVGPFAGLIAAVLPLAMQIAVNHGRMKAGSMGTVPATALAAQVETAILQQETAAMQAQMQAEEEAARMRTEIENSRRAMADAMRDHAHESADVVA